MIFTKHNKLKTVFVICCALFLCLTSVFAYARYIKAITIPTVYNHPKSYVCTLSADRPVYDFGCYTSGDTLDSVMCIEGSGTLAFSWDEETKNAADIAVVVENYSPDANGKYKITGKERVVNVPFSLIVSDPSRVGRAYLDVLWTPDGAAAPTLFARYLIMLNPYNEIAPKPQIIATKTGFISNSVFKMAAITSEHLIISLGGALNEKFPKGTVYCSAEYQGGVTLLRDSLICLGASDNGTVDTVIKFPSALTENVEFSVGLHQQNCVVTSASPNSDANTLTADFDKAVVVLNPDSPLTLAVTEGSECADGTWNDSATDGAQLNWSVERFDGKKYVADNSFATVENKKIKLILQDESKPAGTYRLVLTQKYNGFTVSSLEKVFFVDYR